MSLTDALLFLAFILANMACGAVAMFRYARVSSILAQRHPEIWRTLQGLNARGAGGRFYGSMAPFRLNDPELSRAVIQAWIATGAWIALALVALATAVTRSG